MLFHLAPCEIPETSEKKSDEQPLRTKGRPSGTPRIRELLTLLLMSTGSWMGVDFASPDTRPLPQYSSSGYGSTEELPTPDEHIESIFMKLPTPERYAKFLKKYVKYDGSRSHPITTFHMSPEEFQEEGFHGVCNNMARLYCECMERHGCSAYYVNLIPRNVLETRPSTSHQISFIRTDENTLWICDNLECFVWQSTIENYISERHPHMRLAPWGIARYRRPKENFVSRALIQLHTPVEIQISPLPPQNNAASEIALH